MDRREKPKPFELRLQDYRVKGLRWGSSRGRKVLAVHGWLDNALSFEPLARELKGVDLRAIDLPGHGKSGYRKGSQGYAYAEWVADLSEIADRLKWKSFTLMGHSLGAGISTLFAGTFPERVEKLVLIDAIGPFTNPPERAPEQVAKYTAARAKMRAFKSRIYSSQEKAAQARKVAFIPISIEASRILMKRALKKKGKGFTASRDPRLLLPSATRFTQAEIEAFILRIRAPTLLFLATKAEGPGFGEYKKTFERVTGLFKDLRVIDVAGGHYIHMEQSDQVGKGVRDFIA